MTRLIVLLTTFLTTSLYGQPSDTTLLSMKDSASTITIITIFEKSARTKDGFYLDGYIVDLMINDKLASQLDGKKIEITGQLFIEKGLNSTPPEYDETGRIIVKQGRMEDIRHILSPVYKVVRE